MDRIYTKKINEEIDDAFITIEIVIRAKIERMCNNGQYNEAKELEKALITINNTDFNH